MIMKRYVVFSKPYLLIEDTSGKCQPFFKEYEYDKIPRFHLDSPFLCCPFLRNKRFKSSKKRKSRKGGFCENCYVKYVNYDEHVRERAHREFALDNRNYREVDEIVESFAVSAFDPDLYCPVSPLFYKSSSLPAFENCENGMDTLVFGEGTSGDEMLYRAVHKVENFINEFLNE